MNETPKITLSTAIHREIPVVKVEFAYNRELIDALKARTNARWSATMNCWYIPKDKFVLGEFFTSMKPFAWIDYSAKLARICPIPNNNKHMSRKYKFHNPDGVYFITFSVKDWVDVFTRKEHKNILIENLEFCQKNKGLEIFAWCIMSNHVHLIARAKEGFLLSDILRDYKKFTSKTIIKSIQENNKESRKKWLLKQFQNPDGVQFWEPENHPVELWSNAVINQRLDYIHQNPVKEGLVFRAEDYMYSSAVDYAGRKGLLDVIVIE